MINFKVVRYRNFLSTGNQFTEVPLDSFDKTMIYGKNGHGKSTLIDAICFAMFNQPFRKITKNQLINSVNKGKTLVELEFDVDNKNYLVRRGIKPNKFEIEIEGKPIDSRGMREDQEFLESITQMNFKTFTQIAIIGSSSYRQFMTLVPADRRIVMENILSMDVFRAMTKTIKGQKDDAVKLKQGKESQRQDSKYQYEHLIGLKDMQSKMIKANKDKLYDDIIEHQTKIKSLRDNIAQVQNNFIETENQQEIQKIENQQRKLIEFKSQLNTNINNANKILSFYEKNDVCPTCKQSLQDEVKTTHVSEQTKIIEESTDKLTKTVSLFDVNAIRLENHRKNERINSGVQQNIDTSLNEIQYREKEIKKIQTKIDEPEQEINMISDDQISDAKNTLDIKTTEYNDAVTTVENYDIALKMLRDDGMKKEVMEQYIPVVNEKVNQYLEDMDFFCNFTLDTEFNEKILSRYRDDFTYESFSEGQKFRIDLALLFTWRDIAAMRNAVNTNLLIMDEVFNAPLDDEGMNLFVSILSKLCEKYKIIIITPRIELVPLDSFDRRLFVELEDLFSVTKEV